MLLYAATVMDERYVCLCVCVWLCVAAADVNTGGADAVDMQAGSLPSDLPAEDTRITKCLNYIGGQMTGNSV